MKILAFERKVKSGKSHFLEKYENENIIVEINGKNELSKTDIKTETKIET